ncbi:choice-of-anchor A family protein [Isoptericola sp. NPDC057391]|uniref:choice-of-anchor A family protein n=1 Tax=Isoptericola sp. NPDC057391 TaxID=3346117 RepID=UPI003644925D
MPAAAPRPLRRRPLVLGACAALAAGPALAPVGAAATAGTTDGATKGAEAVAWCAELEVDRPVGVYDEAAVVDDGVGIYVGGDLAVSRAKELEGRIVVAGDADLARDGGPDSLNVGTAGGGGSAIAPAGGSDHLVVGGDLTTGPRLQVGFSTPGGGNVVVGGRIAGDVSTESFVDRARGTVRAGVGREAALAPYSGYPALARSLSDQAAASATDVDPEGGTLTLRAPGSYRITAAEARGLEVVRVDGRAPVAITVSGAAVSMTLDHVEVAGERVYQATQFLGSSLLWSFPDAASVDLGTNGQLPGSVVVPGAGSTLTVATSTNGRILAAGDVAYTGGHGIEHHNYPWTGDCGDVPAVTPPGGVTEEEGENGGADDGEDDGPQTPAPTTEPTPTVTDDATPGPATPSPEAEGEGPVDGPAPADESDDRAGVPDDDLAAAAAAGAEPPATPSGRAAGEDALPRTGAQVGLVAAVAAALLGAGGLLVALRRRTTRRALRG